MNSDSYLVNRLQILHNQKQVTGNYVLYWMQQSQRIKDNLALYYAIDKANEYQKPLIVYFAITPFPEANLRHYHFMLTNLINLRDKLAPLGIKLLIEINDPVSGVLNLANEAILCVTDRAYLRIPRTWRIDIAQRIKCHFVQIEDNVLIPVEIASNKEEYSAFTLRKKIHRIWNNYLTELPDLPQIKRSSLQLIFKNVIEYETLEKYLAQLKLDSSINLSSLYKSGEDIALHYLYLFIGNKLMKYDTERNDPNKDSLSNLSPYLHFGQVSPIRIAIETNKCPNHDAFIEELIIRRELSMNFVYYNQNYDDYSCLPDWAKTTLNNHRFDKRPYLYPLDELEQAQTHDEAWNSAQKEMIITGKMHAYMRMYWGKKILEWTTEPETAFHTALYLNNKYELDGRDPNAFAGVAWCFGKHDRPWQERPVFGMIRYMNYSGLTRKFNLQAYISKM